MTVSTALLETGRLTPATPAEFDLIRSDLPEIDDLTSASTKAKVASVWASFLHETTYASIAEAPAFPGVSPAYNLAAHTRHVVANCRVLSASMKSFSGVDCDDEVLLAAALLHDASKLVEYSGPAGEPTELGKTLIHAQIAGVRCFEAGLDPKVAYIVTYHPFTPPHVHVKPRCIEFVILSWADLGAVDPIFFANGQATHLDIAKRFFTID